MTERSGTLQIVSKNDSPTHRLALARRHVETAIAHINDVAQSRVPMAAVDDSAGVDELRLIVRALADIREALRTSDWSQPVPQVESQPATIEH